MSDNGLSVYPKHTAAVVSTATLFLQLPAGHHHTHISVKGRNFHFQIKVILGTGPDEI
jgi:hypothetical protein